MRQPVAPGRGLVLVSLMLTMALTAMDGTIVATAIPSIVRDLGGFDLFPWVFSVYLLVQSVTIPVYGKLADLYGRKPVLLVGCVLFLLGSGLSGLSWNMVALIVFRGLQGVGAGAVQPITMTVIGDLFQLEERARIQGYTSSVWGVSAVVGPAIGGLLVQYASWHWVFFINLPIGAAALAMLVRHLHERVVPTRHAIDVAGAATLMGGIGLMVLGLLQGGVAWPWGSLESLATFAAAALLLGWFVVVERRAPEPVMPLWVFGHRTLMAANLAGLMLGAVSLGVSSFLPTYVQLGLGATPLVAGFALAAMSVGWPLAASQAGRLYLRFGFRETALLGSLVGLGGALLLGSLGLASTPWQAALGSFVVGLGLGLGTTSLLVGVQSLVGWNRRGVVTAATMFTRMLGGTLGVAVYGSLLDGAVAGVLRGAPAGVAAAARHLLTSTSLGVGSPPGRAGAAMGWLRQGLAVGVHRVFLGMALAAILAFALEALMPRGRAALGDAATTSSGTAAASEGPGG